MAAQVVFVVSTSEQWSAAVRVADHLDADSQLFDPHTNRWEELTFDRPFDRPRVVGSGYLEVVRAARRFRHRLRVVEPGVVVFGQDVGLAERACIAEARRSGWQIALMPDGLVVPKVRTAGRFQKAKDLADVALGRLGLLAGERGRMGSSRPDLVLSWGGGWDEAWRLMAPEAQIVVVGSPRSTELESVAAAPGRGNVLICSQPFATIDTGLGGEERSWWAWLGALAARDQDRRLRIRLHPGEVASGVGEQLGPELQARLSASTLVDDLAWSDLVISPLSTVLLEAAACHRHVASVDVGLGHLVASSPFFGDPRLPTLSLEPSPSWDEIDALVSEAADTQLDLGDDYLANPACAAALAARAVEGLSLGR